LLRPDEWKRLLMPVLLAGHDIVFLGGPGDVAAADAIIAVLGRGRNLCGELDIVQSAKMAGRAAVYYGIDSMLLHLARALGVPTVSLFGPTDPNVLLRPLAHSERVAFAHLPCSPCIHVNESPPCQGRRPCMALALETFIASPDREPVIVDTETTRPPVGWAVDPAESKVHEIAVNYS
jgi:ADP-heptose:LPS heptosyltransferase